MKQKKAGGPSKRRRGLSARTRNALEAYTFLAPFIVGVLVFFAFPILVSVKLSFGTLVSMEGFKIEWSGFGHYMNAFVLDASFVPTFLAVASKTLIYVPLIIIFSLILAIMLNKNIRCKGFFRVAMFLPFLLGSGYIMQMLNEQGITTSALSLQDSPIFPSEFLSYMGPTVQGVIDGFFEVIVSVLWSSGVQILIFLSGLQGISSSLYESAQVDGANEVEVFFKITMPMMAPIITLNIIYTLVNLFTASDNAMLKYIQQKGFWQFEWEYAAALGWLYFIFILALVALVMWAMNRLSEGSGPRLAKQEKRRRRA